MNTTPSWITPDDAIAEQHFVQNAMGKLRRRKWSVVLVASVLFLTIAVGIQALPKTYQGIAMVEADAQTTQAIPGYAMLRDQQFSDYTLGSELTILKSPELLTAAVRKLNLEADPEFNPALKPGLTSRLHAMVNVFLADYLPNKPMAMDEADKRLGETINGLLHHTKFEPIPHSRDIQIIVSSHNPVKAAQIANTIATFYENDHLQFAQQITARAHTYADANLERLRDDATRKAQRVATFKTEHGIVISGDPVRQTTLLQEQASQVSQDLTRGRADLAASQGRYQTALHTDPGSLGQVLNSLTIQKYREQEATVSGQLSAMGDNYSKDAPQLGRLKNQLADIRAKIAAESKRSVQSLRNDISSQEAQVASLNTRLTDLKAQIAVMTGSQADLVPLQKDADAASALYDTYATTIHQTDASMLFPATTVRIVSHAAVPVEASFPNNTIMLPAAGVLSLGVAGLIGWTRENRRKGVVSTNEVEAILDCDTLGMLPRLTKHNEILYRDKIEELFNRLWYVVADPNEIGPNRRFIHPQSILITSAKPQEGKTTTARALALAAAERDIKVLLLDADMRTSRLISKGVNTLGLGDVLRGQAVLDDVVHQDRESKNLTILPSGHPRGIPTKLLALSSFDRMFDTLKMTYDLIIIDAPPTFVGGDCWMLSQKVDRTAFITKWGSTTPAEINEAIRRQIYRPTLAGAVINMVDPKPNMQYGHTDAIYLAPEMTRYYKYPRA